jgi:hypothetical protein
MRKESPKERKRAGDSNLKDGVTAVQVVSGFLHPESVGCVRLMNRYGNENVLRTIRTWKDFEIFRPGYVYLSISTIYSMILRLYFVHTNLGVEIVITLTMECHTYSVHFKMV